MVEFRDKDIEEEPRGGTISFEGRCEECREQIWISATCGTVSEMEQIPILKDCAIANSPCGRRRVELKSDDTVLLLHDPGPTSNTNAQSQDSPSPSTKGKHAPNLPFRHRPFQKSS